MTAWKSTQIRPGITAYSPKRAEPAPEPETTVLNDTTERYGVVVEASDREEQAIQEWKEANRVYEGNPSTENAIMLVRASLAKDEAVRNRKSVVKETFPEGQPVSRDPNRPVIHWKEYPRDAKVCD